MTLTVTEFLPYVIGAGALLYTLRPLLSEREEAPPDDDDEAPAARLVARRDVIYSNIRDLEFETAMGKLSETDSQELRDEMLRDAALVLEELDVVEVDPDLDRWIEEEALRRRSSAASRTCPKCAATVETGNDFCETCGEKLAAGCAGCGAPIADSAKFCGRCGARA